jgi:hypothetical protein
MFGHIRKHTEYFRPFKGVQRHKDGRYFILYHHITITPTVLVTAINRDGTLIIVFRLLLIRNYYLGTIISLVLHRSRAVEQTEVKNEIHMFERIRQYTLYYTK